MGWDEAQNRFILHDSSSGNADNDKTFVATDRNFSKLAVGGLSSRSLSIKQLDAAEQIQSVPDSDNGAFLHLDGLNVKLDDTVNANSTIDKFNTISFLAPSLGSTEATVTSTHASTLYINDAPSAGNAGGEMNAVTIGNSYSLWIDSGNVRFDDNLLIIFCCS